MAIAPRGVSGTSTGSNSTTVINDTGKSWTTNQWANYTATLTSGSFKGQQRTISSNTATSFTVSSVFGGTPSTDSYQIANTGPVNPEPRTGGGTTVVFSLGVAPAANSLIVVGLSGYNGTAATVGSVTDNKGNTYTNAVFNHQSNNLFAGIWYLVVPNTTYSAPYTITIAPGGASGAYLTAQAVEYTGNDTNNSTVLGPTQVAAATNTTSPSTGNTSTTSANCQLWFAQMNAIGSISDTITEPSGFTTGFNEPDGVNYQISAQNYEYGSGLNSTIASASWTLATSQDNLGAVATFNVPQGAPIPNVSNSITVTEQSPVLTIYNPSNPQIVVSDSIKVLESQGLYKTNWQAGMETGDMSEWNGDGGGAINVNSGPSVSGSASSAHAFVGSYSLKMTIYNVTNSITGCRFFRWNCPTVQYYSAWYYFDQNYSGMSYWNVFQWKDSANNPSFVINVQNSSGGMNFWLFNAYTGATSNQSGTPMLITPGKWTFLEAFYRCDTGTNGQVTVWQDGSQIINVTNVNTQAAGTTSIYWGVSNYTDNVIPSTANIYVDNLAWTPNYLGYSFPSVSESVTTGESVKVSIFGALNLLQVSVNDSVQTNDYFGAAPSGWTAGYETADNSEWTGDGAGSITTIGGVNATYTVTTSHAHNGTHSNALALYNLSGVESQVKFQRNNAYTGYYDTWYYFPQYYSGQSWWDIMTWEDRFDVAWAVNVESISGSMYYWLLDGYGGGVHATARNQPIPIGSWTHLQVYYDVETTNTGSIQIWQDGSPIISVANALTLSPSGTSLKWGVSNWTDNITPSNPAYFYVDDHAITPPSSQGSGGTVTINVTDSIQTNDWIATPMIIAWWAGMETGNISEWNGDGGGDVNVNTAAATGSASQDYSHSGFWSLKMVGYNVTNNTTAVRFFRWNCPSFAFYSAWYYFPTTYSGMNYWNVFQWKDNNNNPAFVMNVENVSGQMYFWLYNAYTGGVFKQGGTRTPLQANKWIHLECFYVLGTNNDGQVIVSQDEVQIINLQGVTTQDPTSSGCYWGVSNYTDNIVPSTPIIYVDDCSISNTYIRAVTQSDPVFVTDRVSHTETVTVSISQSVFLTINVSDRVTTFDFVGNSLPSVNVSDSVRLAESITVQLSGVIYINVGELILTFDTVSLTGATANSALTWTDGAGAAHDLMAYPNILYPLVGRDGWGVPEIQPFTDQIPGQAGSKYRSSLLSGRTLVLPLQVVATDNADLSNWRDTLMSWFNPYLGAGTLQYQRKDGSLRSIQAVYEKGLDFDTSNQVGPEQKMAISLYCPDPFWVDPQSSVTQSYNVSGAGGQANMTQYLGINNDATGLVWPEFWLTGPFSNPTMTFYSSTADRTDKFVGLNVDVAAGQYLHLVTDYNSNRGVYLLSGTNMCPNPSFEYAQQYWSASGSYTIFRTANYTSNGSFSLQSNLTGGADPKIGAIWGNVPGVVSGNTYAVGMQAFWTGEVAANALVSWEGSGVTGTYSLASGSWTRIGGWLKAGNSPNIRVQLSAYGTTGNLYLDSVIVYTPGTVPAQPGVLPMYFDGDMAGCNWTGTQGLSTSVQTVRDVSTLRLGGAIYEGLYPGANLLSLNALLQTPYPAIPLRVTWQKRYVGA